MSDVPQGPGWWQASDDKWYPPPRPSVPNGGQASPLQGSPVQGTPVPGVPAPTAPTQGPPAYPGPGAAPASPAGGAPAAPPQGPPGSPAGGVPYASAQTVAAPSPPTGTPPPMPAVPGSGGGLGSSQDLPPVGGSRPGSDRPVGLYAVLAVLVVGVLVSLVVLVSSDDESATGGSTTTSSTGESTSSTGDTTDTSTSDTTGTTGDTTDSSTPAGDGEVVAVEQGLTSFEDPLLEAETYSWGVIVENRSDQVATSTNIIVGFLNDEDRVVDSTEVLIQTLLPGQRFGIGDAPYEEAPGVVALDVRVEPPDEWRDPEGYAEIETGEVNISYDSYEHPTVAFDAQNPYDQRIENVIAYCILRNTAGDIVGGSSTSDVPYLPENGSISASIDVFAAVPDVDESKTEIYVDPLSLDLD
jgi:hypothetical protein